MAILSGQDFFLTPERQLLDLLQCRLASYSNPRRPYSKSASFLSFDFPSMTDRSPVSYCRTCSDDYFEMPHPARPHGPGCD